MARGRTTMGGDYGPPPFTPRAKPRVPGGARSAGVPPIGKRVPMTRTPPTRGRPGY